MFRINPNMKMDMIKSLIRGRIYPFSLLLMLLWLSGGVLWATADWTILVYMAADNGLSEYAVQDINEMESATIPAGTNVIVQADFYETSSPSGAFRYKITHDETSEIESQVISNLGEIDSGDWHTLQSYINWGFSHYPATHKALVIWSHGDSWYKGNDYKWICPDNNAESIMSVSDGDLRNALAESPFLDVLLFDACSMQSIEVLNEVCYQAKYVIGSEDLVPATGFPYQDMLPVWQGEPDSIALQIPELYTGSYAPYGSQNPYGYIVKATCSVLATERLNDVTSLLGNFIANEIDSTEAIFAARQLCYNLNTYDAEIDLLELLDQAVTFLPAENVTGFIQPLQTAIHSLVVAKSDINYDADIGYLTIWFPHEQNAFNAWWQQYVKLRMSDQWLGLISRALGADSGIPGKPILMNTVLLFNDLRVIWEFPPAPEFISIKLRYKHDNEQFENKEINSYWAVYGQSDVRHNITINDIQGSGWLIIWAEDYDGNSSLRDSVYVEWVKPKPQLFVYPNPCANSRAIYFNWWTKADNDADFLTENVVRIYNIKGRMVKKIDPIPHKQGSRKVDLSSLPSGIYIARVKVGKTTLTTKFTLLNDD